jgi:ribosomal protein L37AE/L43A
MGIIEDIMKAFDRIPGMKDIQALPEKVQALELRIASLEAVLARCPAEGCPFCGALAFRLERVYMHGTREIWHCEECGKKREFNDVSTSPSRSGPRTSGRGR